MCSRFPNTFSRGTVQKFRGTLVCQGTPFENPCARDIVHGSDIPLHKLVPTSGMSGLHTVYSQNLTQTRFSLRSFISQHAKNRQDY
jgi:hypothetical protein